MTHIRPLYDLAGVEVVDHGELRFASRAVVQLGKAPDGLPWLCEVADRSGRIGLLHQTISGLFETASVGELPEPLRFAVENTMARSLLGVHDVTLDGRGAVPVFVTRRSAREFFGATILQQALEPETAPSSSSSSPWPSYQTSHRAASTIVTGYPAQPPGAYGAPPGASSRPDDQDAVGDAVQRSIAAAKTGRHVIITLGGEVWTATVGEPVMRTPTGSFRRAVFESLAALQGATAVVRVGHEPRRTPLSDRGAYITALTRATESPRGATVDYDLPRATVLRLITDLAKLVGDLHANGVVHGDLTPGNVLLDGDRPTAPDGLYLPVGEIATAATFEWAAPEQVTGRPLDPRADVYSLGKMLCTLIGAVPYGEKVEYIVPTGGKLSQTVTLLKTDGVFIDTTELGVERDWQAHWQGVITKLLCYDCENRPATGSTVAEMLSELAEHHPPPGTLSLAGNFGEFRARASTANQKTLARVLVDG